MAGIRFSLWIKGITGFTRLVSLQLSPNRDLWIKLVSFAIQSTKGDFQNEAFNAVISSISIIFCCQDVINFLTNLSIFLKFQLILFHWSWSTEAFLLPLWSNWERIFLFYLFSVASIIAGGKHVLSSLGDTWRNIIQVNHSKSPL